MPEISSPNPELRQSPRRNILQTGLETVQAGNQRGLLLIDISKTGIGIQSVPGLELEKLIRFSFTLPGLRQSIEATGMMAWSDEGGRVGFRFIDMNSKADAQLQRWFDGGAPAKAAAAHSPSKPRPDTAVKPIFPAQQTESRAIGSEKRERKVVLPAGEIPQLSLAGNAVRESANNLSKLRIVLTRRQLILSSVLFFTALTAASAALILVATTAYRAVINGPLVQTPLRQSQEQRKVKPEYIANRGNGSPAVPETQKTKLKTESSRPPSLNAPVPSAKSTPVPDPGQQQLADQLVALGEKYAAVDCKAALNYFETASAMEDARALIHLGAMYATGKCVAMDPVIAYNLFVRASKRSPGNRWLRQNLTALLREMTPEQRESLGK